MTPATFADFLDGLSRAMGLPVAPTVSTRRVSLPAAPAQAALAAELDAVDPCPILAVQLESGYVQMLNCAVFLPALEVRR